MNLTMKMFIIILFNIMSDLVQNVSTISSPDHLILLAKLEVSIYEVLNDYYHNSKYTIPIVEGYLLDFKDSSLKVIQDQNKIEEFGMTISKNPILSYRMIRRYVKMLQPIYKEIESYLEPGFTRYILMTKNNTLSEWPIKQDLEFAMESLLIIYHAYNLDLKEFTSGNIMGTKTFIGLEAKHCQEIGEYAVKLKHFTSSIFWLETAFNKTNKSSSLAKDILKSLRIATETHDIAWNYKTSQDYFFFQDKLNGTLKYDVYKPIQQQNNINDINTKFWNLCSGRVYQTNKEMAQLVCFYETRDNSGLAINPYKFEQLSKSPDLIQMYDVLSNKFINEIKSDVIPNMTSSPKSIIAGDYGSANLRREEGFSSGTMWTQSLSQRIEIITGLNVLAKESSESFQTSVQIFGGYITHHVDYLNLLKGYEYDNRVATMLFYLEDVEIGGLTAFPKMGTAAKPVKGSAILFYNMLKNGETDPNTIHGACPVVIGHKWVTRKWIRNNAQMLTRSCGLNSNE